MRNDHYVARINTQSAGLASVHAAVADGQGPQLLGGDHLVIQVYDRDEPITVADYLDVRLEVERNRDYLVRVRVIFTLPDSNAWHYVVRTYDFTRGPLIYEQIEIAAGGSSGGATSTPEMFIDTATWTIVMGNPPLAAADDLLMTRPNGPLGGTSGSLWTRWYRTDFALVSGGPRRWSRALAVDGEVSDGVDARILGGQSLVVSAVIPAFAEPVDLGPLVPYLEQHALFRYYPGYGLRQPAIKDGNYRSTDNSRFVNFNDYDVANGLVPLTRRFVETPTPREWLLEDGVLRMVVHLVDRMRQDGGWMTTQAWTGGGGLQHDVGEIYTPHARCFPIIAYLWSYLTIRRDGEAWVHEPQDADEIYETLQNLRPFYGLEGSSELNFRDSPITQEFEYISYSSHHKERTMGPLRRVLNSHAHALHFAWFMASASAMRGDAGARDRWTEIVSHYHAGSKGIYRQLYPARHSRRNSRRYSGLVNYSADAPTLNNVDYSDISHEGIAAGYDQSGEYEPEFIAAVERACRLDHDPKGSGTHQKANARFVRRLARVCPLTMAFGGADGDPQSSDLRPINVAITNPEEIALYSSLREQQVVDGEHIDYESLIIEGQHFRKLIYTNHRFSTAWLPGYWREGDPLEVPRELRYWIAVAPGSVQANRRWVVVRTGMRIEIIAEFGGLGVTLEFPWRTVRTRESYRDYNDDTYRWDPRVQGVAGISQLPTSLPDGTQPTRLLIPVSTPIVSKRIVTIDIEIIA